MISLQVEIEDLKKLMNEVEAGYTKRNIHEVEFYRGIIAGFDIIRRFLGLEEKRQDKEQAKQFGG